MASFSYDEKAGKARFFFRYSGTQYNKTRAMESARHAERLSALIEETIEDLARGKRSIPDDADVVEFIVSGGKVAKKPTPAPVEPARKSGPATIRSVFDTYLKTLTPGSKAENSIDTEKIHSRHFARVLGAKRQFEGIGIDVLQRYVDKRAGEGVVRDTIRKELATLRGVWGWAHKRKHVPVPVDWKMSDLTLPKAHEKPPFQTWDQITRKIERGGLGDAQKAALWECLWLDQTQTLECLEWVRENARRPFIYPMFAFAAYTGARRGEMVRSDRDDWDFEGGIVALRERKADRSKTFTLRNVSIHPKLDQIMREWFDNHPGGQWTIADEDGVPLGGCKSTKHFRATVEGSKWEVLRGWHVFRHSLASNMASAGTDQRIINAILGHHTEEMERRYRHLLPSKQEHALSALFRNGAAG
jgi:integrase